MVIYMKKMLLLFSILLITQTATLFPSAGRKPERILVEEFDPISEMWIELHSPESEQETNSDLSDSWEIDDDISDCGSCHLVAQQERDILKSSTGISRLFVGDLGWGTWYTLGSKNVYDENGRRFNPMSGKFVRVSNRKTEIAGPDGETEDDEPSHLTHKGQNLGHWTGKKRQTRKQRQKHMSRRQMRRKIANPRVRRSTKKERARRETRKRIPICEAREQYDTVQTAEHEALQMERDEARRNLIQQLWLKKANSPDDRPITQYSGNSDQDLLSNFSDDLSSEEEETCATAQTQQTLPEAEFNFRANWRGPGWEATEFALNEEVESLLRDYQLLK